MEEELKPAVAVKRILKSKTIWINVIALIAFSLEKKVRLSYLRRSSNGSVDYD